MDRIPVRQIRVIQKEQDFFESFTIRDIAAEKDMIQELHRHDFYFILALKKGTGYHDIDFTTYNIEDRTVFFMRPGQVHQLLLKAGSIGYLMELKEEFFIPQKNGSTQLLRRVSNVNHYQVNTHGFQKLSSIMTSIFDEYTGKQERYQDVIKANMEIFLIELLRQSNIIPSEHASIYQQEILEKFLELLEVSFFNQKQVSLYASALNLSVYQLNTIAKVTLGKNCSELINNRIMLEAKRLLLATSGQINQIAYHLGYEDVSYFIRFFRKHTGYSPEVFRNNFR